MSGRVESDGGVSFLLREPVHAAVDEVDSTDTHSEGDDGDAHLVESAPVRPCPVVKWIVDGEGEAPRNQDGEDDEDDSVADGEVATTHQVEVDDEDGSVNEVDGVGDVAEVDERLPSQQAARAPGHLPGGEDKDHRRGNERDRGDGTDGVSSNDAVVDRHDEQAQPRDGTVGEAELGQPRRGDGEEGSEGEFPEQGAGVEVDGAVGGCEPDEPHQRANRDESEDHESHRPDAPAETLGDERAEGQNDGPEEEHLPLHRHRPQVHERTRHRTVFCEVIRGHVNEAPVLGVGE